MEKAFARYLQIISQASSNGRRNRKSYQQNRRHRIRNDPYFSGNLEELTVTLTSDCESVPYQGMDESCKKFCLCFETTSNV